jgi:hypothetical protein
MGLEGILEANWYDASRHGGSHNPGIPPPLGGKWDGHLSHRQPGRLSNAAAIGKTQSASGVTPSKDGVQWSLRILDTGFRRHDGQKGLIDRWLLTSTALGRLSAGWFLLVALALPLSLIISGCGLHFSGGPGDTPFPPNIKTIVLESAVNNTTVTGIETELTNDLRDEFALGTRLNPVRSGGDVTLKTVIADYQDTDSTYRAEGKELIRIGTIKLRCTLEKTDTKKILWKKDFSASNTYNVTDIAETLSNRRRAISRMIKDLIPRIQSSMFDNF